MSDLQTVHEAASREVRGHGTAADDRLLHADPDAWAAALRAMIAGVDRQLDARDREIAHYDAAGDTARADTARAYLADWWPRASRFQVGCNERLTQVDQLRAAATHQQLRREVAALVVAGQLPDAETGILADLLAALDERDPLDWDAVLADAV